MSVFVTGTDTDIGKTRIAAALLHAYAARGLRAIGMKPVAAGCDAQGRNEDVNALRAASSFSVPREAMCPYLFKPAIAPHIAAAEVGVEIDIAIIEAHYQALRAQADVVVVEGAGGFIIPLNATQTSADLVQRLGLPVVLVVGMRLGCLNHALLTQEAILARGLQLAGWVANRIDPQMSRAEANLATLRERLDAPLLGDIPYQPSCDAAAVAPLLDLAPLLP